MTIGMNLKLSSEMLIMGDPSRIIDRQDWDEFLEQLPEATQIKDEVAYILPSGENLKAILTLDEEGRVSEMHIVFG